jgi:hypothetical protein
VFQGEFDPPPSLPVFCELSLNIGARLLLYYPPCFRRRLINSTQTATTKIPPAIAAKIHALDLLAVPCTGLAVGADTCVVGVIDDFTALSVFASGICDGGGTEPLTVRPPIKVSTSTIFLPGVSEVALNVTCWLAAPASAISWV